MAGLHVSAPKPRPCHDKSLAQGWLGQPNSLQANTGHNHECRGLIVHGIGNPGAQVFGHARDIGMGAVRNDPLAGPETVDTGPDSDHTSDVAITKRQGLSQF